MANITEARAVSSTPSAPYFSLLTPEFYVLSLLSFLRVLPLRRIAVVLLFCNLAFSQAPPPKGTGHWEGTLNASQQNLPIVLDLTKGPTGQWVGSFSIPMANALDMPVTKVAATDDTIRFTIADLPGGPTFDAKFAEDGAAMSGSVSNGQVPLQFDLKRTDVKPTVKVVPRNSPLTKEFEGTWGGAIDLGDGTGTRVAFEITRAPDGTASGRLINIDNGNQAVPITTVTIRESMLQLDIRGISASYVGVIGATGEIDGTWSQGKDNRPLRLQRATVEGKK